MSETEQGGGKSARIGGRPMTAPDPSPDPAVEGLADVLLSVARTGLPDRMVGEGMRENCRLMARFVLDHLDLAARDAAQQRIGAERALREAAREGANQNTPEGFAIWLLLTARADRIEQEEA